MNVLRKATRPHNPQVGAEAAARVTAKLRKIKPKKPKQPTGMPKLNAVAAATAAVRVGATTKLKINKDANPAVAFTEDMLDELGVRKDPKAVLGASVPPVRQQNQIATNAALAEALVRDIVKSRPYPLKDMVSLLPPLQIRDALTMYPTETQLKNSTEMAEVALQLAYKLPMPLAKEFMQMDSNDVLMVGVNMNEFIRAHKPAANRTARFLSMRRPDPLPPKPPSPFKPVPVGSPSKATGAKRAAAEAKLAPKPTKSTLAKQRPYKGATVDLRAAVELFLRYCNAHRPYVEDVISSIPSNDPEMFVSVLAETVALLAEVFVGAKTAHQKRAIAGRYPASALPSITRHTAFAEIYSHPPFAATMVPRLELLLEGRKKELVKEYLSDPFERRKKTPAMDTRFPAKGVFPPDAPNDYIVFLHKGMRTYVDLAEIGRLDLTSLPMSAAAVASMLQEPIIVETLPKTADAQPVPAALPAPAPTGRPVSNKDMYGAIAKSVMQDLKTEISLLNAGSVCSVCGNAIAEGGIRTTEGQQQHMYCSTACMNVAVFGTDDEDEDNA